MALLSNALTTYERASSIWGVVGAQARIEGLINLLSAAAERICGRKFGFRKFPTDSPEWYRGNGMIDFYVKSYPIKSVAAVSISGISYTLEIISNTSVVPLQGLKIFRSSDWDEAGKLHAPMGWTLWTPQYQDLTNDPAMDVLNRLYNVQIAYSGGYILPQYDGVENDTHNPNTLPTDIPADLEGALCQEVMLRLIRPSRDLIQERTPGGLSQSWGKTADAYSSEFLEVLYGYRTPEAVWA